MIAAHDYGYDWNGQLFIPVKKGDEIHYGYNDSSTTIYLIDTEGFV